MKDLTSPPTACGKLRECFSQQKPERSALVNNRWRKIRKKSLYLATYSHLKENVVSVPAAVFVCVYGKLVRSTRWFQLSSSLIIKWYLLLVLSVYACKPILLSNIIGLTRRWNCQHYFSSIWYRPPSSLLSPAAPCCSCITLSWH